MEFKLGEILTKNHLTLSSAESLTGGLFGETITSHPGASKYYKGGIITYSNSIKEELGVNKSTIEKFGAVSKETATEMVKKAQQFFNSDVAVSFTGNAGPTAMENKPVGLVYIGIAYKTNLFVYSNIFSGTREEIRKKSVEFAIEALENLF